MRRTRTGGKHIRVCKVQSVLYISVVSHGACSSKKYFKGSNNFVEYKELHEKFFYKVESFRNIILDMYLIKRGIFLKLQSEVHT